MIDKFIRSLDEIKTKLEDQFIQGKEEDISSQEKQSKLFMNEMLKTSEDGLNIFEKDKLFRLKLEGLNFSNSIRDQINYGNLDLSNPAILNGYKMQILNGFEEIRHNLSPYDHVESNEFMTSVLNKTMNELNESGAKAIDKKRLDMTLEYLNYDSHRHDDYEDILDSESGSTAYNMLVAYLGANKTNQYINEQRLKNLENMTFNENISDDLYKRYALEKVKLNEIEAANYINRRRNLRLQSARVYSMNIDEIRESSHDAAYEITKFNNIFDQDPSIGLDNAFKIYLSQLNENEKLSSFDKELKMNAVSSYINLSKEKLNSNPLDYLVARNLASSSGFTNKFPLDKGASRLEVSLQTAMYSPEHNMSLFTENEINRMKYGDVTLLPFLNQLRNQVDGYSGKFSQEAKKLYYDSVLTYASPVIFSSIYNRNTENDINRITSNILKNPSLPYAEILDKYMSSESNKMILPFTRVSTLHKLYNGDSSFRKLMQNEFAKLFVNGEAPDGIDIETLAKNSGLKFYHNESFKSLFSYVTPPAWTTKNNVDFVKLKADMIGQVYRYSDSNNTSSVKSILSNLRKDNKGPLNFVSKFIKANQTFLNSEIKNIGVDRYTLIDKKTGDQIVNVYTGKPIDFFYEGD
ncbi:MAG: hypothetical protein ACRCX2_01125 [Paraclostridium sp.]